MIYLSCSFPIYYLNGCLAHEWVPEFKTFKQMTLYRAYESGIFNPLEQTAFFEFARTGCRVLRIPLPGVKVMFLRMGDITSVESDAYEFLDEER